MRAIVVSLVVLACRSAQADLLVQWNTFGNTGTETTEPSVANDARISPTNLTLGSVTPAANGNRFGGSNWFDSGDTVAGTTLAESISGNDYIQFIVTPLSGFTFTPSSLVFRWDRSGTGPDSVALRYSVDSFAANLGSPVTGMISGGAATTTDRTITFTSVPDLSTPVTFRLYGFGATATGGTGGFDMTTGGTNNVILNGTTGVAAVPEASVVIFGIMLTLVLGLVSFYRKKLQAVKAVGQLA